MDTKLIKYLERLALFKDVPRAVLAKIVAEIEIHRLARGTVLIRKGDESNSLFIIRTGWVKIVAEENSEEEVVLNQCGPGQVIGEMSLIDHEPRSGTVILISAAEVLEIQYSTVLSALNDYPQLAFAFLGDMSDRMRFSNAYIEEAIQWCQYIAAGNYDFVQEQLTGVQATIIDVTKSHEARASAFLSAFFTMVEGVKEREDKLKEQVHQLTIEIDEAKRRQSVQDVVESDFFQNLKETAQKLRQSRPTEQRKKPGEEDVE